MKDLKIGTQLKMGFAVLLFFVIALGGVAYYQSQQIHEQTDALYNHPLKVRRAIGAFRADVVSIQRDIRDMLITTNENEIAQDLNQIEINKASAFEQIDVFYSQYLGPRSQIDSLKKSFITWNTLHVETLNLLKDGKKTEASERARAYGVGGKQADIVLDNLKKIDDFALLKGNELFDKSGALSKSLTIQLIYITIIILLLSLLINYILLRRINKPITELILATQSFHDGEMDTRSNYKAKNEFGVLSDSFNNLADSVQSSTELKEKVAIITEIMLSEDNPKKFFQAMLTSLSTNTNSQIAAVYLLSDDKKYFEHFESIGLDENAKTTFESNKLEGEFGVALSSLKLQHLKSIPEDTKFIFNTVSGKFIPKEIITIPILAGNEVIAIISLASIHNFNNETVLIIDSILSAMSARIDGILAYQKNIEFSKKLEMQNSELEAQKTELSRQSAELIEQNTELEMQKKQLSEATRLKTNFLSNMSHELRTPLNSVIALSGVLNRRLEKQIPEEEYSYLEVIERNGKHLLTLINDILDISRIESGREEMEITKFNANALVADVVNMILPQAKQRSISLTQLDNGAELTISNDSRKLRHILQNIIVNAVKFTEKGKVEVKSEIIDQDIIIKVTDTGIGIDENHIKHIFDEFRQADGSTSRKFGGTGLGLAIAKKYTNLLGGSITVNSKLGEGSEFIIKLPINYAVENRIVEEEQVSFNYNKVSKERLVVPGSEFSGKTILLVEDSEPAIIQMKDILEESGYKVIVARDGAEALGITEYAIPDALILDLMMPGVDGFEVLKNIREEEKTKFIPVLILTAKHITKEDLKFLKTNNVHQLVQKGDVSRKDLLNYINRMVFPEIVEVQKEKRKQIVYDGKPVILVVEDNRDNMVTVKALLDDKYTVLEAFDGHAGIELAKLHKPDLILMDIALPGIDGIEAFKIIRKDANLQYIPIIALTASAMIHDRETILAHGFDVYIPKPIDDKIFFKTINEVLYGE